MNTSTKPPKRTRAQLQRDVLELTAQLAHVYHFADQNLDRTNTERLMGSGVLLQLTGVGGKEIIDPVMIKDGLSDETIAAIRKDLKRSYDLAIMFAPKESVK